VPFINQILFLSFCYNLSSGCYKNFNLRNLPLPYYHADGDLRRTSHIKELKRSMLKDPCYGITVLMITDLEQTGRGGELDDGQCHNIWFAQSRPTFTQRDIILLLTDFHFQGTIFLLEVDERIESRPACL
jgi:hypothetical protein